MERLTALALAAAIAGTAPGRVAAAAPRPAAARPAAASAAPAPEVATVALRLPPGEDAAAVEPLVTIVRGDPLTRHAVRRTVQSLHAVGRFSNVVVRATPLADGRVAVEIECTARVLVREVRVAGGAAALDARALARAAALAAGDELTPERLDAAAARAREALRRRGWRAARVEARALPGDARGVPVELAVEEGPATRVAAFRLTGEPGPATAAGLRTTPGAPLDEDALADDVARVRARLHALGHLRARVEPPAIVVEGERATISLPVSAGPRVRFRFSGERTFDAAALEARLGIDADAPLDAVAIEAAAARLRAVYQQRGHADARVSARELAAGAAVVVLFEIEEGPRYRIGEVRFTGADHRDPRALRAELDAALEAGDADGEGADAERAARALGSPSPPRSGPPRRPAETYDPGAWDAAIARIVEAYREDGFLEAAHEGTRVALDARRAVADVEIRLREGPRTLVSSVDVEGNSSIATAELVAAARLAPGAPLSYAALERARAAIAGAYARRGQLYARVLDREEISADRTRAAVRIQIEEGPLVRVGNVVVSGNRRTRADLVRDAIALRSGDPYDPDAAARSQAALLRLGVFRSVGLRLSDPEVPQETKDLTVELAERPWRSISPGVGFSIANGPRAFVELVQPNLFGLAVEGTARVKVNYPLGTFRPDLATKPPLDRVEFRTEAGLHERRLHFVSWPAGARIDGVVERLHRRAYELARGSSLLGLDLQPVERLTVSLQYELELDHVLKSDAVERVTLTRADVERLRFPEGYTTLQSIRPVVALDFRDSPVHPHRGWAASTTLDYVRSIGSGGGDGWLFGLARGSDVFTHMLKLSGVVSAYAPLGETVLALSVRGGRVLPLDRTSQTIGPKRFFMGGATTMRGYAEDEMLPEDVRAAFLDQVRACAGSLSGAACSDPARQITSGQALASEGGEAFFLAKAELRVPVRGALEAGIFADAGNLWLDPRQATLTALRLNLGVGARFATPIGPAALDLGFNVEPDARLGESRFAPHFSIGLF